MTAYTPHDYQEAAIQRVLAEPTRAALIGDEVGRGKTLVSAEIILRAGWKRVLLIGIPDTFEQWDETIQRQSNGTAPRLRRLDSTKVGRAHYADFLDGADGLYFAGMQWLNAQDFKHQDKLGEDGQPIEKIDKATGLPTGKFERERVHLQTFAKMSKRKLGGLDAVIFDEAHQVCNYKSVQRRTLLTLRGRDRQQAFKIALSATWSGNSFDNAWSLTNWLWPELIPAYWNWHEQWVQMRPSKKADGSDIYVGGRQIMEVAGEREPGEFVKTLPCYIRNEAEEQAPEPVRILVDSTPEQRAQYEELKEELMTWASNWEGEREPLVVDIPAVLHSRLKQVALAELSLDEEGGVTFARNAASAKLRALRGILDQWGAQPVVIFTDSKLFAKLAAQRMRDAGYTAVAYTGDTKRADRQQIKADFIEGRVQYVVGTVQSMGTGLDGFQRVCSKVVWLSVPDGDPGRKTQALGRVFRPGRTLVYGEFVHAHILMSDSLDVDVLESLLAKGREIQASVGAHNLNQAA
ncbi:helicase-related protein [Microbacterium sp. M]|uniref:helicase-related protein n=1 Tax=Microbacterium sp. M TaxID=3377125 RepID=UPI00386A416C